VTAATTWPDGSRDRRLVGHRRGRRPDAGRPGRHRGAGGPAGKDRLDAVLADCRATSPARSAGRPTSPSPTAAGRSGLTIWDHYGGLDVVINNAAVPMRRHATQLTMAEVERTMRINYFSPVAITLALLPRMLERSAGTIVNVSSLGGRLGIATEAAYSGRSSRWPDGAKPWPSTSTARASRSS
jgi:NAD(P)-dependent dehydrogenase (short-subunit alcohol dehydrogenase family)